MHNTIIVLKRLCVGSHAIPWSFNQVFVPYYHCYTMLLFYLIYVLVHLIFSGHVFENCAKSKIWQRFWKFNSYFVFPRSEPIFEETISDGIAWTITVKQGHYVYNNVKKNTKNQTLSDPRSALQWTACHNGSHIHLAPGHRNHRLGMGSDDNNHLE